jgi:hypothetical protein
MASPRLTVRAVSEMLGLPAHAQVRILHDQKYPKQQPQVFMTPYYQKAIAGIRNSYGSKTPPSAIAKAKNEILSISNATRRQNNIRVLDQFSHSAQAKRALLPQPNKKYVASIGDVEIRLSTDLQAKDSKEQKYIYFYCKREPIDIESTKNIIDIAHWLLSSNGVDVQPNQIEIIDINTGILHTAKKLRPGTIKTLKANAKIIETLWPTI